MEGPNSHFHRVRYLGRLRQPASDSNPLEWEESEVVWVQTSAPPAQVPNSPRMSSKAQYSGSNLTAVLSGPDPQVTAIPRGRNPSPDGVGLQGSGHGMSRLSAPVDVPGWPRWMVRGGEEGLQEEHHVMAGWAQGKMVPPHQMAANSQVVETMACSVFEGAGRTLKGRDLRRVRNGVFRMTGFLD